jgi:hypothetical protein
MPAWKPRPIIWRGIAAARVSNGAYSSAEIDKHRAFSRPEDVNRSKFEGWTFIGDTNTKKANDPLLALRDGETAEFEDQSINLPENGRPMHLEKLDQCGVLRAALTMADGE